MSFVHSTYFEATPAKHPSRQFDMQTLKVPASHGPTKRKPTGDLLPVGQENEVHPSPTKRMCTSSADDDQGRHVLAPSGTSQSGAAHTFVDVLHQKGLNRPGRPRSRSNAENVSQVHTSSIGASPSLHGAFPGVPNTAADSSPPIHSLSPEKLKIIKGKQPDRRHKHHKHEARQDPAQQFLSFMHNLQMQMVLHNEAQAAVQRPTPAPSEPPAEPESCSRSRFGPVARYPGVMYESPFEGMLVKRSPWPAAAVVMQEVGCECSICVRALAKRLEDGNAPPSAATLSSPHSSPPAEEQPPALEPAWIGGGPRNPSPNPNGLPAGSVQVPTWTAPSSGHQFFPHITKACSGGLSNVSHSQAEAGPSKPSMMRLPPSGQELFSMLFAASMAGLGSTVG